MQSSNKQNLITVIFQLNSEQPVNQDLKSAVFNVRSVTNKSFFISQLIEETWLDSNGVPIFNDLYLFRVPRGNKRGGRIACL